MMEKAQAEKECQTDAYLLRDLLEEGKRDASESSRLQTRQKTVTTQGLDTSTGKRAVKEKALIQKFSMLRDQNESIMSSGMGSPKALASQPSHSPENFQQQARNVESVNVPYENPMVNFGKTRKMLGLENHDYLMKLQVSMDIRFEELYKKEVEKIKDRGETEKKPNLVQ